MRGEVAQRRLTAQQYLELEPLSEVKHEWVNGELFAMAGASAAHNRICFNLAVTLGSALVGSPCRGYTSDQRVRIPSTGLYTYPELTFVCGEVEYDPFSAETLINPTLLVEVLSPSTEAWDRGGRFAHYRRLPSLSEFLLVAQDRLCVEHYLRQGDTWVLTAHSEPDAVLTLASWDAHVRIATVYSGVDLPPDPGR